MTEHTKQDKLFDQRELRDALQQSSHAALQDFTDTIQNGDADKRVKLWGLFDVTAPIASIANGLYNEGTRRVGRILQPHSYELGKLALGKLNIHGANQNRSATIISVAANLALSGAATFKPLVSSYQDHRVTYKETARTLAPLLDDIVGNHSVDALMSIRKDGKNGNEMIYAHRQRMSLKMKVENTNNVINLIVNAGPAILETQNLQEMWTGNKHAGPAKENELVEWLLSSFAIVRGTVATYITGQNSKKLAKSEFSALDMVLELDKQVSVDPHASGYQMPGQHHGHDYPLDEYIKQVIIRHQADMADISDKHTEIRDALKAELANVSKRLAKAISGGDINTLSLVRMIGEGHLIKKQGRAIAPLEDVEEMIRQASGKQSSYVHVDPADYYKDASFNRDQLRTALKALEGEEKRIFAAMFPDSILEEAGMATKDIKAMRDATAKEYDTLIAESIVGLNAKTDDELKAMNLAQNEIKHLRDAAESISANGIEAVKEMKIAVAGDRGVEHLIANAVVHDVNKLGLVVEKGRSALKEAEPKDKELSAKEIEDAREMSDATIARVQRTAREGKMPELGGHTGRLGRHAEMDSSAELGA